MLDAGVSEEHNESHYGELEHALSPSGGPKKQTHPFYIVPFSPSGHDIFCMRLLLEQLFGRRFPDQELHTLYQLAILQQRAGEIDPKAVIYTPFMRTDVLSSPKAGDRIYHPNPQWSGRELAYKRGDNEGKFIRWKSDFDENGSNGSICSMLARFPESGVKRLIVNVPQSHTFPLYVWGWYTQRNEPQR